MELRHLQYFVATADAGTVSAAATALHITQPGLSRQLRQLERELGVELFNRATGRLELSATGRVLLPRARDLLRRADGLRVAADFYANGWLDRITIGGPTVTLTDVVAPFVATLTGGREPRIDVLGADGRSPVDCLSLGADLAIGTAHAPDPFCSQPLAVLPVWACVPPRHRWSDRESVTMPELVAEPLIVLPPTFTSRQALDATGPAPTTITEAANGTIAQALAAAGRGIAVVSDDPRFGLIPLRVEGLSIRLVVVWDSRHAAAATLKMFAGRLGDFARSRYGVPAE